MVFSLKIAWRFLRKSKSQTILIILGIAIGVSVQVFVGSLIQGLQIKLIDQTIGNQPHITITSVSDNERIADWEAMKLQIANVSGVTTVIETTDSGAFIIEIDEEEPKEPIPILLRGFDLDEANDIYGFYDNFTGYEPENLNEVIVGINLKEENDLTINSTLMLRENPNPILDSFNVTVRGFFDLGVANLNELWVITNTQTVSDFFSFGNNITSLNVQVEEVFDADIIAEEIKKVLSDTTLEIANWKKENAELESALSGQTISSLMIQIFIIVSVVIAIASILAITVVQKSRQIGILKAMGVDDGTAARIFLMQGIILGVLGALTGIILGLGLGFVFQTFALEPNGNPIIPLYIDPVFIVISFLIAVTAAVLSSLIPARKSSKLTVIEVIRSG